MLQHVAFLQVFMNNAHDTSLHEMLRKVNIQLSERESASGLKQCMEIRVNLVSFKFKMDDKVVCFTGTPFQEKPLLQPWCQYWLSSRFMTINKILRTAFCSLAYSPVSTSLIHSSWLVTRLYTPGKPGTAHL